MRNVRGSVFFLSFFLSLSCTCMHLHESGLVCLASKLSLWSHRTNLTDEKKKRVREGRGGGGGAARRDESAAEVLSRGEEETEEQGGRGQGRGESELS